MQQFMNESLNASENHMQFDIFFTSQGLNLKRANFSTRRRQLNEGTIDMSFSITS